MKTLKLITTIVAVVFMVTSCDKEDMGGRPEFGGFNVRMTDSPADYAALDVEITGVEAYLEGSGWIELNSETQMVSVLTLTNGTEMTLAQKTLVKSGHYTMLKVKFGDKHSLTFNAGASSGGTGAEGNVKVSLNWSGDASKEVIIAIDENIEASSSADILLDFNAAESIEGEVTYSLDPVISVIEDENTAISGKITGAATAVITVEHSRGTLSTYADSKGEFTLKGVSEGSYDVTITAGSSAALNGSFKQTVEDVVVVQGQTTFIGEIRFN